MRWIGLAIIIGAVVLAALPVAADQPDGAKTFDRAQWIENKRRCDRIVKKVRKQEIEHEQTTQVRATLIACYQEWR